MGHGRFKAKTVIVTGAGQGVGKEVAIQFAREGAYVVASDVSEEKLKSLEDIFKKKSFKYKVMKVDVSRLNDIQEMVDSAVKEFGNIDILINNAGVSMTKEMMDLTEDDWDKVLSVNVKGTFFTLKTVAKRMIQLGKGGCIVNVASIAGEKGRPLFLAYSASKAAVINITMSTALELAKYKINVNAVAPGTIDTPMWQNIAKRVSEIQHTEIEKLERAWIDRIPMKRLAKPEDIASLILYLCSDEASYITGQTINICGGLSVV